MPDPSVPLAGAPGPAAGSTAYLTGAPDPTDPTIAAAGSTAYLAGALGPTAAGRRCA
jgi:hypothetical protein